MASNKKAGKGDYPQVYTTLMASQSKGLSKIPSDAALGKSLDSPDELAIVVRGHQSVEVVLDHLIDEVLPNKHRQLTVRLPFMFKVDLAIAMFGIPAESRPALAGVNNIRNQFAHKMDATLTVESTRGLYNILSPYLRYLLNREFELFSTPALCFKDIIFVLFVHTRKAIEAIGDNRLYEEVLHDMVEEMRAASGPINGDPHGVHADIKARFEKRKAERPSRIETHKPKA